MSRFNLFALQLLVAMIAVLVLVSRLKHEIISLTANFLDVLIVDRDTISFLADILPNLYRNVAIAVLLGVYPEEMTQELSTVTLVPSVPVSVATGLPVELLRRRPDIQQAERELAGAHARIGVATANLFPSLFVSGSLGAQRQQAPGLPNIGEHIWSLGAGAAWPGNGTTTSITPCTRC